VESQVKVQRDFSDLMSFLPGSPLYETPTRLSNTIIFRTVNPHLTEVDKSISR